MGTFRKYPCGITIAVHDAKTFQGRGRSSCRGTIETTVLKKTIGGRCLSDSDSKRFSFPAKIGFPDRGRSSSSSSKPKNPDRRKRKRNPGDANGRHAAGLSAFGHCRNECRSHAHGWGRRRGSRWGLECGIGGRAETNTRRSPRQGEYPARRGHGAWGLRG